MRDIDCIHSRSFDLSRFSTITSLCLPSTQSLVKHFFRSPFHHQVSLTRTKSFCSSELVLLPLPTSSRISVIHKCIPYSPYFFLNVTENRWPSSIRLQLLRSGQNPPTTKMLSLIKSLNGDEEPWWRTCPRDENSDSFKNFKNQIGTLCKTRLSDALQKVIHDFTTNYNP